MSSSLAIAIAIALGFVGTFWLALWLIGKPARDRPECNRCGADLRGAIWRETKTCAACGADWTKPGAVRLRGRTRRWRGLVVAMLLIASGVSVWRTDAWMAKNDYRWHIALTPTWWDLHQLSGADAAQAAAAAERLLAKCDWDWLTPRDALRAAQTVIGRTMPSEQEVMLAEVCLLQAGPLAVDPAFARWLTRTGDCKVGAAPVRPGGSVLIEFTVGDESDLWNQRASVDAVAFDGVPRNVVERGWTEEGEEELDHEFPQSRVISNGVAFKLQVPPETEEGLHVVDLDVRFVAVPYIAASAPVDGNTSLSEIPLDQWLLLKHSASRHIVLPVVVLADGDTTTGAAQRSWASGVYVGVPSWGWTYIATELELAQAAALAGAALPFVLIAWLLWRWAWRGAPTLIPPECVGCRAIAREATRCAECGRDLSRRRAVRYTAWRWHPVRRFLTGPTCVVVTIVVAFAASAASCTWTCDHVLPPRFWSPSAANYARFQAWWRSAKNPREAIEAFFSQVDGYAGSDFDKAVHPALTDLVAFVQENRGAPWQNAELASKVSWRLGAEGEALRTALLPPPWPLSVGAPRRARAGDGILLSVESPAVMRGVQGDIFWKIDRLVPASVYVRMPERIGPCDFVVQWSSQPDASVETSDVMIEVVPAHAVLSRDVRDAARRPRITPRALELTDVGGWWLVTASGDAISDSNVFLAGCWTIEAGGERWPLGCSVDSTSTGPAPRGNSSAWSLQPALIGPLPPSLPSSFRLRYHPNAALLDADMPVDWWDDDEGLAWDIAPTVVRLAKRTKDYREY